jgi:hypothetical protein
MEHHLSSSSLRGIEALYKELAENQVLLKKIKGKIKS